nr:DivIVA domain-containing protein [Nocardioides aurantiacus]
MPLTPEDVSTKRFTPTRLREGYDQGEVDQFLDEVEAELGRLLKENEQLRSRAGATEADDAATGAPATPAAVPATSPAETPEEPAAAEAPPVSGEAEQTAAEPQATPAASGLRPSPHEQIRVTTSAEASSAATRLLELATRNADEVVAEARQEAQEIVASARTEAEQLQAETRQRTDQLDEEARTRAQNLDAETEGKRSQALADIEREKQRLDTEVDNLRAFEREYRSRLKSYFTQQLEALDGRGEGGELPAGHGHPQDDAGA